VVDPFSGHHPLPGITTIGEIVSVTVLVQTSA